MNLTLNPPSTLLMGPAGSGKTSSLVTLLREGLKLRLLAFEPSAPSRIVSRARALSIPLANFAWNYVSPAMPTWDALVQSATLVNKMTLSDIAELRTGIAKPDGTQWIKMLHAIADFKDAETGEPLGDATEWGPDTAFAVDGLTGLSTMSRNLTVGLKPNPHPGEWGVMQSNILNLVNKLAGDCKGFFVLIAHVDKGENPLTGLQEISASTLGAKLAPKLPPLFTNVIYAKKIGTEFFWSTAERGVDTKNGDLPLAEDLAPDFKPVIEAYRSGLEAQQIASTVAVAT